MFIACENDVEEVNALAASNAKADPVESSKDVEMIYSDSAQIKMKLVAGKIDRFIIEDKSYFEMDEGLHIYFYDNDSLVTTELKADNGKGFDNRNGMERMEVENNVVLTNEEGNKLNTEYLEWDALRHIIHTDKFVKITTKDEIIWGHGLEANEDFSEYEIMNVKGQLTIDDSL